MKKQSSQKRSQSYCKPKVEISTTSKIKEGFFNFSTNITYRIGGGLNRLTSYFNTDSNNQYSFICLHGKKYHNQTEAKSYMKKIIWFSYRKLPGLTKDMHSDTGWGCLIRVGQMALAAGLKRYLDTKLGQKSTNSMSIITVFVENGKTNEKYSLKKIVQYAHKKFELDYGSWFKTYQICDVIADLHYKDPLKSATNLGIIHFKGSTIYLQQIYAGLDKRMCQCKKRRIFCDLCNTESSQINPRRKQQMVSFSTLNNSFSHVEQKPQKSKLLNSSHNTNSVLPISKQKNVLIFINCRVGSNVIGEKQYEQILQLLELECSLGIIGGVPGRGYYFVGFQGNQLIYLDPHLVQDQVTLDKLHQRYNSFFTDQLRRVSRADIDPSMAFVFMIDNLATLKKLYTKLEEMSEKYDNPIMIAEWVNKYKNTEKPISEVKQDQWEVNSDLQNSFVGELENDRQI